MGYPPLGSTLDIFGISIPWYSLLIMVAFAIGILLASREEKRLSLPKDTVLNFSLLAIPLGLIGARLYYVAFAWDRYADNLWEIFRLWNGGLAIYGGVLGGILAAWIVTRGNRTRFLSLLDACAPSLVLGQAIGRWGNYANVEAYGARIYDEALQFFPLAVQVRLIGANGTEYVYWHMATFFYESVWCLLVFIILMAARGRMKRRGDVIAWYGLLYCAGRTMIEGLRDDSLLLNVSAAQVRISQILSAVVCVAIAVLFFVRLARSRKLHLSDALSWVLIVLGIACAFVGEFERNAYQMLFIPAQLLLAAMLAVDILFFIHYYGRARRLDAPAICMLACMGLCVVTLLLGIGRLGQSNIAYVALRQSVSMLHVVLSGAWFYLRCGPPKPVVRDLPGDVPEAREAQQAEEPREEEAWTYTLPQARVFRWDQSAVRNNSTEQVPDDLSFPPDDEPMEWIDAMPDGQEPLEAMETLEDLGLPEDMEVLGNTEASEDVEVAEDVEVLVDVEMLQADDTQWDSVAELFVEDESQAVPADDMPQDVDAQVWTPEPAPPQPEGPVQADAAFIPPPASMDSLPREDGNMERSQQTQWEEPTDGEA